MKSASHFMSKSKRIALWLLGTLVIALAMVAVVRVAFRPPMPGSWRSLHAGMSRSELFAVAAGEHGDTSELKGFDTFTVETTMLGEPSYWQLLVTYDQAGRVLHAQGRFVLRTCGLLNQAPRSVL